MIRKGDVLYIHSLDRFSRNKEEIVQELNDINKKYSDRYRGDRSAFVRHHLINFYFNLMNSE